jgi:Cd2+/Zn2+-exporting ATPase
MKAPGETKMPDDRSDLASEIADAATLRELSRLSVRDIRCRDCPLVLERRLVKMPGATSVKVNPASQTVAIEFDAAKTSPEKFEAQLQKAGYKTSPAPRTQDELHDSWQEQDVQRRRFAILTGVCLVSALAAWFGQNTGVLSPSVAVALYVVAYFAGGVDATRRALVELRNGSLNVDLLMVLAAAGAASVGEWPEGATLLFLFSLSNTLESFVLGRTRRAIQGLMKLSPDEATVRRADETGTPREMRVPVETLLEGETIIVRPGERIAADGEILAGQSSIDQSAMTGESVPVEKARGDNVFAGTLNGSGVLEVEVTHVAGESTLSRIVRMVEEAQDEKAPAQEFTDWFGSRYTVAVIVAAMLAISIPTLLLGEAFGTAFYRAMTLLVVASPCAVVISIPAALMAAIAGAARGGVLFKGGAHLEETARLRAIAFDKTGTLTVGRPRLVALQKLRVLGLEHITMLTGDAESVAAKIAGELGISYRAGLMPGDKLDAVKELHEQYGHVGMAGDGINDAPSLAAADLGISLGGAGTDVALETADVVLMSDDLHHLPYAIALARQTRRIILQNLVFAFGMMALLVAGTFFASLRLPLAVLGHEGSTVLVILNGLRLLTFRTKPK